MKMANQGFSSFSAEAIGFLKELKANNNREWFSQHKETYERSIKIPSVEFCTTMVLALEEMTGWQHNYKIYRIYRDVRFSKDKTPYKPHLHISFTVQADMVSPPCWFFGLEPERLIFGAGIFSFEKPALETYRNRIVGGEGNELAKILGRFETRDIRISEPALKRVPSGFDKQHQYGDLLKRKGISAWIDIDDPLAATGMNFIDDSVKSFKKLKPLNDWLLSEGA